MNLCAKTYEKFISFLWANFDFQLQKTFYTNFSFFEVNVKCLYEADKERNISFTDKKILRG